MRRLEWAIAVSVLILAACGGTTVYHHYEHTEHTGWEKIDTLSFNVPRAQADAVYNVSLGLRTTERYPFQSVVLIVEHTTYPSHKIAADTINCRLTTPTGQQLGQGLTAYQYAFPVTELAVNKGDSLHITVRHDMKREILPGITEVGIKLTNRTKKP